MTCTQPDCTYTQDTKDNRVRGSGNLVRHYKSKHKSIVATERAAKEAGPQQAVLQASFFVPRAIREKDQYLYNLLLNFIVQNNLLFRIVDQPSFKDLVHYLLATTVLPHRRDLCRNLKKTFLLTQQVKRSELQDHIEASGRVSLTTDTWSAKNKKEFMVVTVHMILRHNFENKSFILDVIELTEPVHSGKYISEQLFKVTEFYGITMAVFTCSRDNAKPNDCLL
jgi:hypothetical protein